MQTIISRALIIGGLFAALIPSTIYAQAGSGELARRLVGEGIEAARSRDWVTARQRFERAYTIQPLPLTLFNLASAQEKTGLLIEADRSYRLFLREINPGEYPDFRQAAIDSRGKLRGRIAHVTVKVQSIAPNDILKFGDGELSQAVLGEALPANPGDLQVAIERRGQIVASKTIVLAEGDSKVVELTAPPLVAGLPAVAAPPPSKPTNELAPPVESRQTQPAPKESPGIFSSPIFWSVLAGVVAAGAGVGIYYGVRPENGFDAALGTIKVDGR